MNQNNALPCTALDVACSFRPQLHALSVAAVISSGSLLSGETRVAVIQGGEVLHGIRLLTVNAALGELIAVDFAAWVAPPGNAFVISSTAAWVVDVLAGKYKARAHRQLVEVVARNVTSRGGSVVYRPSSSNPLHQEALTAARRALRRHEPGCAAGNSQGQIPR